MFDTIVVGVDGGEGGRDALALADTLQRTCGSAVVAVTAYPSYDFPRSADHDTVVERDATAFLREEVRRAGVGARTVAVPEGSPARALHDAAKREHADLIVVGSDHGTVIGHMLAGDVTASTLYGSPVAVAVAPQGLASRPRTLASVGVAYDRLPESRHALELARAIADATDARLEVITVEDHVTAGPVAAELARRSAELDLLVVGSRGFGPVRRLLLGSTSSRLVRCAPCPVIVLARGVHVEAATQQPALAGAPSWRIHPDQLP